MAAKIGVVVIGRNEGERLIRCIRSACNSYAILVYVDSASTDGSAQRAAALGADVIQLSLDKPFTAGRARNAGFDRLLQLHADAQFAQFVDGDCELAPGWLDFAVEFLEENPEVAIVCGRRKERFPEKSIYNRICDIEWDTPVGDAPECGGDFLVRTAVFAQVSGFNGALIAGEEPEMCHRIRGRGWRIHRADRQMTLHDAAMTRFRQWFRRTSRSGYAYAARATLHWRDRTWFCWKENARIVLWALLVPVLILLSSLLLSPWFWLATLIYPLQYLRIMLDLKRSGRHDATMAYAFFVLLGKWPEFYGQMLFLMRLVGGKEQRIIEYK